MGRGAPSAAGRWFERLGRPVDGSSLAAFRVLFGLLMAAAMIRFAAKGWIRELYLDPTYHFSYWGLDWIRPPGEWGTYALFAAIGLSALAVAAGRWTRLSVAVFTALFTWVELIDKTTYLNHYYFISVAGLWLCILPAGRARIPAWTLWALRTQVGLVYLFAGLAKVNADWLLEAMPLRIWLNARSDMPGIGPLLSAPLTAYAAAWAGLLFDTTAPFLLLWKRSRPFAYAAVIAFHLATAVLFPIGMFPWIMMASATVFFDPAWPRKLIARLRGSVPVTTPESAPAIGSRLAFGAAALLLAWQLLVPMRSLLYSGDSRWHEQGYRFSWRVMLVEKLGTVTYTVRDADGSRYQVDPCAYLTPLQARMMAFAPDMIRQCAGWIGEDFRRKGHAPVAITADARVSINGRPSRTLIDPSANLLEEPPARWVLNHD